MMLQRPVLLLKGSCNLMCPNYSYCHYCFT